MNTVEKYKKYVNTSFVKAVEPVVITQAKGATVTDEDGKTYTDLFAGISVVNAGHCNPAVLAAAKAQMDKLVHCCSYVYHVPTVADLAEKLAQITPGRLQKSFFGNGGAEANEGAMRLAKQFTKRQEFISLQGSFHGRSLATLSITGNCGRKRGGGPYLSGCAFHPAAYCYRCPYDKAYPSCDLHCAKDLERTIQFDTADNVAAFIAEPVMGEGGIVTPPPGYFQEHQEGPGQPRHPAVRRRGPVGLRPHRQAVRHRALGRGAGHPHHGQGHRRRLPPLLLHRPGGDRRCLPSRRPPLHLRRQPRLLRRGPGQHRLFRAGEALRPGRGEGEGAAWAL